MILYGLLSWLVHAVQGLLRELLHLVEERAEARKAVLGVYGEVLSHRNLQEDSALAFTAAQDLPRALEAYKAAGHWQMALALAGNMPLLYPPMHVAVLALCIPLLPFALPWPRLPSQSLPWQCCKICPDSYSFTPEQVSFDELPVASSPAHQSALRQQLSSRL